MRPRSVLLLVLFVLAALASAAGCGRGEMLTDDPRHFVFALSSDPETFDPGVMSGSIEGKVAYQIYEGLVSPPSDDGPPVPGVAERWEMSPDGSTWTFYLRDDARWSNGDPVVAEDFRQAWLRQLRGDIASDYISFVRYLNNARPFEQGLRMMPRFFRSVLVPVLEPHVGARVIDDRTLEVTLQQPTAYFLDIAMFYTMFPVHRGTIAALGDEDAFRPENLVSNGPFRIERFLRRNRIEMVQNEHYWDGDNLGLDAVTAIIIEDNAARVTAYLDRRVDWMHEPPNDQLAILSADPGFRSAPQLGTYYYRFNVTQPPMDDLRVRRALSMALNREELCRCTLDDLYEAAWAFVPPLPGWEPRDLLRFDPGAARDLLAEAGYPNGEGFPELVILYNTNENHRVIAQAVQDMWRVELGIEVQLLNQEWKVYLETMEALDYMVARAGWIGDYVDANTFLHLWRSFDENNNTGFDNADYDRLMADSIRETDPAARLQLLRDAEALLMQEMPVMPIYFYSQFHLVHPSVEGWDMNVRNVHLARWISKTPAAGGTQ